MRQCTNKDCKMRRMRTRPHFQISQIPKEARTACFFDHAIAFVDVLEETQSQCARVFGVVPEILHSAHQLALEVVFVGFSFVLGTLLLNDQKNDGQWVYLEAELTTSFPPFVYLPTIDQTLFKVSSDT